MAQPADHTCLFNRSPHTEFLDMKFLYPCFRKRPRRFRRGLFLCVLLLLLVLADRGFALDPTKDLAQYNCRTWNRQNALPASSINAIAQTQDGYLWFGTAAGLLRFDGIEFKLMDLHSIAAGRNSFVTSLASARSGGLWVGLRGNGFVSYDGQSFSFHGWKDAETTWQGVRSFLEGKDGTLWLVASGEIARLNRSGELETVPITGSDTNLAPNITCGYEDPRGRLLVRIGKSRRVLLAGWKNHQDSRSET